MPDKRLIDANELMDFISDERKEAADNKNHEKKRGNDYEMHFWSGALVQTRWIRQHIKEAPTIDAVEVVRCWECKESEKCPLIGADNLYCNVWDTVVRCNGYCYQGAKMDAKEDKPCE